MANNLKKEEELYNYNGEDKMVSSHELYEIIKNEPEPKIIKSGIPTLDNVLNGFEEGELIVVSGPTSHGKTTLLTTILLNLVKTDIKTSFFTLENSPRSLIKTMVNTGELPLFYLPIKNTENHIQWLLDKILEGCVKYNTKVIFIDHLHQIFSIERMKGNLSLEIGDIVAKLKQIAVEYGLVIFLVAHCTDNKLAMNYEPTIRDIRDSGLISRLADSVIGVWRIKRRDTKEELFKEKVSEDNDNNEEECNKIRIWKSRREGKRGVLICEHKNHIFKELNLENMPETDLDKKFGVEKINNEELGF